MAKDFFWECNECGSAEFTSAMSQRDVDCMACTNCGGDEFHKVYKEEEEAPKCDHVIGAYGNEDGGVSMLTSSEHQEYLDELDEDEDDDGYDNREVEYFSFCPNCGGKL